MPRISSPRIEAAGADRARRGPGEGVAGQVFILRTDLVSVDARDGAPIGGAGGAAQPPRQPRRAGEAPAGGARQYGAARPPPGLATAWRRRHRRRPELAHSSTGSAASAADGREYVTILGRGQTTPAPWINVIANPILRLPGLGRGRRLQLVGQQQGESADALVERSGHRSAGRGHLSARRGEWRCLDARRRSPSARRPRPISPATARAIAASSMPPTASRSSCCNTCRSNDPIKISRLTIRNDSKRIRRLSVTAYVEWVLGTSRGASAPVSW